MHGLFQCCKHLFINSRDSGPDVPAGLQFPLFNHLADIKNSPPIDRKRIVIKKELIYAKLVLALLHFRHNILSRTIPKTLPQMGTVTENAFGRTPPTGHNRGQIPALAKHR